MEDRRPKRLLMNGVCDESVWLKSLTEHVNWKKLSILSCTASDFNHTLSSQTPFIRNLLASYSP